MGLLLRSLLAVSVFTGHVDNSRTNANRQESLLTPTSVASGNFKLLGHFAIDGYTYGQPLYIPDVSISGTLRNVVIVATMHDSVYAFNADSPGSSPLWHAGPLATSRTSYPHPDNILYGAEVGCIATPAVDQDNGWVFAVCTNSTPTWVVYKLNLSTGATISSTTVTATVTGTGDPSGGDCVSGGIVSFCPAWELSRPAVTLANGNVYLSFGSYSDTHPWHGWLIGYNESTMSQIGVFCVTPNGGGGAFWAAGGGPAVDSDGNLYSVTGNGDWDGVANFGNTYVKLSPTLHLLDWFTQSDWVNLNNIDADPSSNRVILIPGTSLLVSGGKDFQVWLLRTGNMGHLQGGGGTAPVQVFKSNSSGTVTDISGSYGATFVNNRLYMPTTAGAIYSFAFNGSTFNTTPTVSPGTYNYPGAATIGGSSYGTSNAVLWMTTAAASAFQSATAGTLRALDPVTMAEIWNSNTVGSDTLGTLSKFTSPTVANGMVFVPTLDSLVQVYGLAPSGSAIQGQTKISGQVTVQ